jgi:hypothetical protein
MVDMVSYDNENINPEKNEGKKEIEAFQEEVDAAKKMEEVKNKKGK